MEEIVMKQTFECFIHSFVYIFQIQMYMSMKKIRRILKEKL